MKSDIKAALFMLAAGLAVTSCSNSTDNAEAASTSSALAAKFDPEYAVGEAKPIEGTTYGNLAFIKGEGTPVVFYYPADQRGWQMQIGDLSDSYKTVAVSEDLSVPPTGGFVSPTHLIDALEHLRAQLGVEKFNLVTHSISGRMGMELAIRRPDLINSLVLEEPAWAPTPDIKGPLPPPEQPPCALELDNPVDQATCTFFAMQMGAGRFEALPEPIREYLLAGQREQAAALAASLPEGVEPPQAGPPQLDVICDQLGKLDFPILMVRGADTPAFFAAGQDYYEGCLPQHDTVVIPNATHMVHFENPEAYNAALKAFLDKHAA